MLGCIPVIIRFVRIVAPNISNRYIRIGEAGDPYLRRIVEPIGKPYGCRSVRCGSIQGIRGAAGRYICRVSTRREIGGIPVKSRGEARGVLRKREPVDKRGLVRPTRIESSDSQGQRGDVTPASKPCDVVRRRIGHRKIRNRLDRCLQTFCTRKPKRCSRP